MIETIQTIKGDILPIGPQGLNAYEVYKKNGGTLSETEWLKSLRGPQGEKGDTGSVKFIVVTELPTENIDETAIYIKPAQEQEQENVYKEFIYVNNNWESLGTPKVEVDLSNYYNKTEANNLLEDKVSKVDGKGLSTNDYTTEEKTKLAGIDLNTKQDTLTAGENITIENNVISASGGSSITELTDEIVIIKNLDVGIYRITTSVKQLKYGDTIYNTGQYMNCLMFVENYRGTKKAYIFNQGRICYFNGTGLYDYALKDIQNIMSTKDSQTITASHTYNILPMSSVVPSQDNQLVNKKYVDDAIAALKAELTGGSE